jgi:hypothetical protein
MKNENNNSRDEAIKSAQFRKNLSIAFFNSTNSAIEMVKLLPKKKTISKKTFEKWRDYFLEEHKKYYAEVMAKIGVSYKASESIEKLRATKTLEELKSAWTMLSADERADAEIRKVVFELKAKF